MQWIYMATGNPPDLIAHLLTAMIGLALMPLGGYVWAWLRGGERNDRRFIFNKQRTQLLEAMSRIAKGDFNVSVKLDVEQGPFQEVVDSINTMARELGSVEQMRQDFISNVSHEIQSPLASISGYASLLKNKTVNPEQMVLYADIIETESKRLSKLSGNLLRLSALESDYTSMEKKAYRLDRQLENILLMLEPQWAEKQIQLDVSLPATTITGNEDLLSQVWINLLHNAIKFTPEEGTIGVTLACHQDKDEAVCTITDNGVGISPEDQVRIFERFFKANKARTRSQGGNGLGLSLVQKIVNMHGGQVTAKSELGQGSEFVVILPLITENS
jgi:signal transduction histidine kinase